MFYVYRKKVSFADKTLQYDVSSKTQNLGKYNKNLYRHGGLSLVSVVEYNSMFSVTKLVTSNICVRISANRSGSGALSTCRFSPLFRQEIREVLPAVVLEFDL